MVAPALVAQSVAEHALTYQRNVNGSSNAHLPVTLLLDEIRHDAMIRAGDHGCRVVPPLVHVSQFTTMRVVQ